jgi:hypothetical protein
MRPLVFKPFFSMLLALAPVLLSAPSHAAAEPTPSELSVARRLFDEGRVAEDAGRWREAADKFRGATAIKDTPGMRFHLARCEEEQGAYVEALVEYDRARELIDSGIRAADVEKLLAGARERVRAKVALLTLRLPKDVQNVSVELDGKALSGSVLGVPMPINPGKHRVSAVAVGRTTFGGDVELGTGEVRQLAIDLPISTTAPAPAAAAAAPPPAPARVDLAKSATPTDTGGSISTRTVALIGEGSLFVVGVATGIGFTVARSSAEDRYHRADQLVQSAAGDDPKACAGAAPPAGCSDLSQALDDRSRDGTLATVGFVAAGISAAAFGLTLWLWPHQESPAEVRASAAPGRLTLSVSGRF